MTSNARRFEKSYSRSEALAIGLATSLLHDAHIFTLLQRSWLHSEAGSKLADAEPEDELYYRDLGLAGVDHGIDPTGWYLLRTFHIIFAPEKTHPAITVYVHIGKRESDDDDWQFCGARAHFEGAVKPFAVQGTY